MIILGGTPIGNLGDASQRLKETLERVSVIACEDTRVTAKLLSALGIVNRPKLVAMHEHNESQRVESLIALARDEDILVLSDAGMPTVSDPGYVLVRAGVDAGVTVTAIPGPSAVVTALAVSGLPSDRFTFEGFVPRKKSERVSTFTELANETRTMIFFESPHRIGETLDDARDVFGGGRRVAVCRELTKMFEEIVRGTLDDVREWARGDVRGEIVVVLAGAPERVSVSIEDAVTHVRALVDSGLGLKDAATEVALLTGHSKRELYQAALSPR